MTKFSPQKILELFTEASIRSSELLEKLGDAGQAEIHDDHVVDIATKGDMAVSDFLLRYMRESGINAIYHSEESGEVTLGSNPQYMITADDIDGSFNYNAFPQALPHCTVLTAFDSKEPQMKDALVATIYEHVSKTMWHAIRGEGCYVTRNGVTTKTTTNNVVKPSRSKDEPPLTRVIIDAYMTNEKIARFNKVNEHAWVNDYASSAFHMAGVSNGIFDAYMTPSQKGHEIGAGYLLIKEAGGVMVDHNGDSVDAMKFDFNGLHPNYGPQERRLLVCAATDKLAYELIKLVK